jgi:hypothetical protein
MASVVGPTSTEADSVFFELDRFEQTDGERLELQGRWFGVRGRRFVRPTLTLLADGERCRALADLAHKPWPAEDGELWEAVFPCGLDDAEVAEVELAVAPDIAVALPAPGDGSGERRLAAGAGRRPKPRRAKRPPGEPAQLREEVKRLRERLRRAEAANVESAAVLARRDSALSRLEEMEAERDAAVTERDQVAAERDAAVAERDQVVAERDAAVAAHRHVPTIGGELDDAISARGAAIVMRNATRAGPVSHTINWPARALAIAMLIAALIALAIVLHIV